MKRNSLSLHSIALLLSLSGCLKGSNHPSYPEAWPLIRVANDIESIIQGKYSCSGEIVPVGEERGTEGNASDLLMREEDPAACTHIDIQKPSDEKITIQIMGPSIVFDSKTYEKNKDYYVEDGWIVLKGSGKWHLGGVVARAVHESRTTRLTVSAENDLIIKLSRSGVGTILVVIPLGGSSTYWGRFKRLQ